MLRIEITANIDDKKPIVDEAISKYGLKEKDILSYKIHHKSLDARRNRDVKYLYQIDFELNNENYYLKKLKNKARSIEPFVYQVPAFGLLKLEHRPVVVGFGPTGMASAYLLALKGYKPIVIERGPDVIERKKKVEAYWNGGELDEEGNVQYGEGGAGAFSDGKLTTRIKDERVSLILDKLIEAGADESISYLNHPHIGTDKFLVLDKTIREKIISLGGEIHFSTRLESIETNNGKVHSILTNTGKIQTNHVLLCCGHSASDTYETLYAQGIHMIQKDFACGVRVEHPQALINQNQYGKFADHPALGAASYSLTHHSSNGRGVYSFCMCPGGVVIPASTQAASLAVNGMSYSQRDGKNANSAILVQIPAKDFDHGHPLDGFAFQKQLEKKAYIDLFNAPSENIKDYIDHTNPSSLRIESSYPRETVVYDMHQLFSDEVNQSLEDGFRNFDHKIPGFIEQGIMVGMESRSSSPIRILRNEDGQSSNCLGLYPCGEGAGYAGGIVSSAVDGIKQAENVIENIKNSH